jgi:hypothetical protein
MKPNELAELITLPHDDPKSTKLAVDTILKLRRTGPVTNLRDLFTSGNYTQERLEQILQKISGLRDVLENISDLEDIMPELIKTINTDDVLGKQWLIDPGTLLEDLHYYPSQDLKNKLRKAVAIDYTQKNQLLYQKLKEDKQGLSKFSNLQLGFNRNKEKPETTLPIQNIPTNPLGSFNLGIQLSLKTVEHLIKVLIAEKVIETDRIVQISGMDIRFILKKPATEISINNQHILFPIQISIVGGAHNFSDPVSYDSFDITLRFALQINSETDGNHKILNLVLVGIDSIKCNDLGDTLYTLASEQQLMGDLTNQSNGKIQWFLWTAFFNNTNAPWQLLENLIQTNLFPNNEGIDISSYISNQSEGVTLIDTQTKLVQPTPDENFIPAISFSTDVSLSAQNNLLPGVSFTPISNGNIENVKGFIEPGFNAAIGIGQEPFEAIFRNLWIRNLQNKNMDGLHIGRLINISLMSGVDGAFDIPQGFIKIKFRARKTVISDVFDCDWCLPDVNMDVTLHLILTIHPVYKTINVVQVGNPEIDADDDDVTWVIIANILWGATGVGLPVLIENIIKAISSLSNDEDTPATTTLINNLTTLKFPFKIPGTELNAIITGEKIRIRPGELLLNCLVDLPLVYSIGTEAVLLDTYKAFSKNSNGYAPPYGWPFYYNFSPYLTPFPYNPYWQEIATYSRIIFRQLTNLASTPNTPVRIHYARERLTRRLSFYARGNGFSGPVQFKWTYGDIIQYGEQFELYQQPANGEKIPSKTLILEATDAFMQTQKVELDIIAFTGQERVRELYRQVIRINQHETPDLDYNSTMSNGGSNENDTIPENFSGTPGDPPYPEIPPLPPLPTEFSFSQNNLGGSAFEMKQVEQKLEFLKYRKIKKFKP